MCAFRPFQSQTVMNKKVRENIQVFVRVRPINTKEKHELSVIECHGNKEIIVRDNVSNTKVKTFCYDKIFAPNSKQIDVYKAVLQPHIEEVLAGYNCTVFAYGQTGTGKTYTMEGNKPDHVTSWQEDPSCGIIPRSLNQLFDELRNTEYDYTVRVSFLELYNEELFDLLSSNEDTAKLKLFENSSKKGSVIISGLEEVIVKNKDEVYKILEKGSLKRQTAATLMNAHSSRSHTIFSITIHLRDEEYVKVGKLNLVDLAGSENIGRSGAIEKRAREAGNINQSLLTLGRVITCLVERSPHIPYRESKLTRLLQDSLGGRTKTSIIATVSPAASNIEETLSTLEYAQRAKCIQNKPEINQVLNQKNLFKEYNEEIERLRKDLKACRDKTGMVIAEENYQQMVQQINVQTQELEEKVNKIKALEDEQEKNQRILDHFDTLLREAKEQLDEVNMELTETKIERDEQEFIVQRHVKTEEELTSQARELQDVAEVASSHTHLLHDKLRRKETVEVENKTTLLKHNEKISTYIGVMQNLVMTYHGLHKQFTEEQQHFLSGLLSTEEQTVDSLRTKIEDIEKKISEVHENLKLCFKENHEYSGKWASSLVKALEDLKNKEENEFTTFFEDVLVPDLLNVIEEIGNIENKFKDLEELTKECAEFLNMNSVENDQVLTQLVGQTEEFGKEMRNVNDKLNSLQEKQSELETCYNKNIEESRTISVESNDTLDKLSSITDVSKVDEEWTYIRSQFGEQFKDVHNIFGKQTDRLNETIQSRFISNKENIEAVHQELSVALKGCIGMQTSLVEDLDHFKNTLTNKLEEFLTRRQLVRQESIDDVKKSVVSFTSDLTSVLKVDYDQTKVACEAISDKFKLLDICLNAQRTEDERHSCQLIHDLDEHARVADKEKEEIDNRFKTIVTSVNKFFDKDLRRAEPTGITPQKEDFKQILEQAGIDIVLDTSTSSTPLYQSSISKSLTHLSSIEKEDSPFEGKENLQDNTTGKQTPTTPQRIYARALSERNE